MDLRNMDYVKIAKKIIELSDCGKKKVLISLPEDSPIKELIDNNRAVIKYELEAAGVVGFSFLVIDGYYYQPKIKIAQEEIITYPLSKL